VSSILAAAEEKLAELSSGWERITHNGGGKRGKKGPLRANLSNRRKVTKPPKKGQLFFIDKKKKIRQGKVFLNGRRNRSGNFENYQRSLR